MFPFDDVIMYIDFLEISKNYSSILYVDDKFVLLRNVQTPAPPMLPVNENTEYVNCKELSLNLIQNKVRITWFT